jgi:hypothetical protein
MLNFRHWLPTREWELLLVTLLYTGLFGLAVSRSDKGEAVGILLAILELGLPLALSMVAAGLIANDPVLDLLLSVAQSASETLGQRLAVLLGYGLLLAVVTLFAVRQWGLALPITGPRAVLIWAAPTALFVGIATVGALLRGRMLDGVALAFGTWGLTLFSSEILSTCPMEPERVCYAALATPMMTLLRPQDPLWLANRVLWLSVGCMLLTAGLWLVRQEERLVTATQAQE